MEKEQHIIAAVVAVIVLGLFVSGAVPIVYILGGYAAAIVLLIILGMIGQGLIFGVDQAYVFGIWLEATLIIIILGSILKFVVSR